MIGISDKARQYIAAHGGAIFVYQLRKAGLC